MNPGPFGMMQTGVPFGEVRAVREWLKLDGKIALPEKQSNPESAHPWVCTPEVGGEVVDVCGDCSRNGLVLRKNVLFC